MSDRELIAKYRPWIVKFHNELKTGRHDTKLEKKVRAVINRMVMLDWEHFSKGDPVRDVEFRYGVDSVRIDSEMEESEK